jgi:hypothetical protein
MPVQGLVRLRKHQFARQPSFGTKCAATRAYPFKGVPSPDLKWTDPEIDTGSLDPTAPPHREAPELTADLTDPQLNYNTIPLLMSAFFGGGVDPTPGATTAETWNHDPSSTTMDPVDAFVYEFGDDVTTDWYQFGDGILTSVDITGPEGLGPLTTSMTWLFGSIASSGSTDSPDSPTVPTGGLSVDLDPALVYLKDGAVYIASTPGDVWSSKITDALHTFSLKLTREVDQKRYANASQEFDVDAYATASRSIELACTFAKTADTVGIGSESDAWMSDDAVTRYVGLRFTSKRFAEGSVPYSWDVLFPMRYYTRTEGEVGGNTVIVLTGRAFYDPTAGSGGFSPGAFESTVVTTLSAAELGTLGS